MENGGKIGELENLFGNEMNSTHKSESKAVRPIR